MNVSDVLFMGPWGGFFELVARTDGLISWSNCACACLCVMQWSRFFQECFLKTVLTWCF